MTRGYKDVITLPKDLTLGDVVTVLDKFREYGRAELKSVESRRVEIEFIEEDDWDLREVLSSVAQEVGAYGVEFTVDKAKIRDDLTWEMP